MGSFLSKKNGELSEVNEKHGELGGMNRIISEYAALLEQVSEDRGELLLAMSKLRLENAELSVSKEIFDPLEMELRELREKVSEYSSVVLEARATRRELEQCKELLREKEDQIERMHRIHRDELDRVKKDSEEEKSLLRRQLGAAKASITKMKGKIAEGEGLCANADCTKTHIVEDVTCR